MWPFEYPYTNFHELNLDWIIEKVKEFQKEVDEIPNEIKSALSEENIIKAIAQVNANVQPVNVLTLGVSNLGDVDCAEIINNAIRNGTKNLFFPAGVYKTSGFLLDNDTSISGAGFSTIFEAANDNVNVLSHVSFSQYANGETRNTLDGTIRDIRLENFVVSGGYNCIALYGVQIFIDKIFCTGAKNINIWLEAPGSVHSSKGLFLQHYVTNVICAYGVVGNFKFNGQSDSYFNNISGYYGDKSSLQFNDSINMIFEKKSPGVKCENMHLWGYCKKHLIINSSNNTFNNLHVEGATIEIENNGPLNIFNNLMIYNPIDPENSTGIKMGQGAYNTRVSGIIRGCKTIFDFGGFNPGQCVFNISGRGFPDNVEIFSNNPSLSDYSVLINTNEGVQYRYGNREMRNNGNVTRAYTPTTEARTIIGYITITDNNGVERKVAVV